jgi:hypothetical protein
MEKQPNVEENHHLLIWTSLRRGDRVSLRVVGVQDYVGTVEARTNDGLIIWVRDDLNERRLFQAHECRHVQVIQ